MKATRHALPDEREAGARKTHETQTLVYLHRLPEWRL